MPTYVMVDLETLRQVRLQLDLLHSDVINPVVSAPAWTPEQAKPILHDAAKKAIRRAWAAAQLLTVPLQQGGALENQARMRREACL